MLKILTILHSVRASYWFIPAVLTTAAILLAQLLLHIDSEGYPVTKLEFLYSGGIDGARSILSTIAASMMTVAGTVFSVTIVVLALASQQFGPRLLRNFMQDSGNQTVLGVFVSNYVFCLMVLRRVRTFDHEQFVPNLTVTVAVLFAIVCVGFLIYFIHHISTLVQADYVIASTSEDLKSDIEKLFPEHFSKTAQDEEQIRLAKHFQVDIDFRAIKIPAQKSGYIVAVDSEALLKTARMDDVVIRLLHRPGQFVIKGEPIAYVSDDETKENLSTRITLAVIIAGRRSSSEDIEFHIDQLVAITSRALSPSLNDEFTALMALESLSSALTFLAERQPPSPFRFDKDNNLRVIAPTESYKQIIDAVLRVIAQNYLSTRFVSTEFFNMIAKVFRTVEREDFKQVLVERSLNAIEKVKPFLNHHDDLLALEQGVRRLSAGLKKSQLRFSLISNAFD